jgi:hypothetical protein
MSVNNLVEQLRAYDSGAVRDAAEGKNDYEGALCPLTLEAYGDYMRAKQIRLSDGTLRSSDNWQLGMSQSDYLKSLWRHFLQLWKLHRGHPVIDEKTGHRVTRRDACCAILFNVFGYLRGVLLEERDCEARR